MSDLDHASIARTLSQIADHRSDVADAFFERSEVIELPAEGEAPGFRAWHESGVAVRLLRGEKTWLAARDGITRESFAQAVRRVARAMPRAPYPEPDFPRFADREVEAGELLDFPSQLARSIRAHHVTFPLRLVARRHRRQVRLIGTQVSSGVESESFYSVVAELPWGRYGALLAELDTETVEAVARQLVHSFRAQKASSPDPGATACVLGPAAAAALLHEAVAHALEADTLAFGGHPEAAIGVTLGHGSLDVFDDPSTAPEGVRRAADDEGYPVVRRCLLRGGVVEQPLADAAWARRSEVLRAGAGRRADRHQPPGPRSTHLELLPGEASHEDLMAEAEGGLFLPEAERGSLDPLSGEFILHFPYGYRVKDRAAGPAVGRSYLRAHVTDVLQAVRAVGREVTSAGAGWCAKGGMKLPVWATTPEVLLAGVRIRS